MKTMLLSGRWILILALPFLVTSCDFPGAKIRTGTIQQNSDLYSFADAQPVTGASSMLLRRKSEVGMKIKTRDLPPEDTFTIWWVIFNVPENCEHPVEGLSDCGEEDLFNESVGGSVLFAAGNIADKQGRADFSSSLRLFDVSGCQPPFDEFGLCRKGLVNPFQAEVHLVVRSHGPIIPELIEEQLGTFAGGCTPESSFGAGDGPNECEDLQFAIFPEP